MPPTKRTLTALRAIFRIRLLIEARYFLNFIVGILSIIAFAVGFGLSISLLAGGFGDGDPTLAFVGWGGFLFVVLSEVLWSAGLGMAWELHAGTIEYLHLAPTHPILIIVGRCGVAIFTGAIGGAALTTSILALGGYAAFQSANLIIALYAFVTAFFAFLGFAFILAALTLALRPYQASMIGNVLGVLLIFSSGFFYPFSVTPPLLRLICLLTPFSYYVDLFRTSIVGTSPELLPLAHEIIVCALIALLLVAVGILLYNYSLNRARRMGTLGKY